MTLIALAIAPHGETFAVSDLAISTDQEPPEQISFPSRYLRGEQPFNRNNIARGEHKSIVFGRHLFMWTGDFKSAKCLADYFFSISDRLHVDNVMEVAKKVLGPDIEGIGFIYCHISDSGLSYCHHNCLVRTFGDIQIVVGGTGKLPLIYEFERDPYFFDSSTKNIFRAVAMRIMYLLRQELKNDDFYDNGVGLAYEFTVIDKFSFRKIPYNILQYVGEGSRFGLNSIIDIGSKWIIRS